MNRLLVTDSQNLKQQFKENYDFVLTYDSLLEHSETHLLSQYSQITVDAIIELYLLGFWDEVITTKGSSFGGFAKCILGKGQLI